MTNKKILTLISLLLFLFLLVGCFPKPNHPPEITSDPVTEAIVEVDYIYNVVATDPDHDVLTYSLKDEPTGMLINEDSGVITWTPTVAGSVKFTVVVTDEGGLFDDQDVTITVSAAEIAKLTGIEVVPEAMALFEGKSKTITSVTAHYSDGSETVLALGDCAYASSATKVATVSKGVVTAIAKGLATITVSYTEEEITKTVYIEETDTIAVTVSAVELDHIVVLPETMTLSVDKSEAIKSITAHYSDGSTAGITPLSKCDYESSDKKVAEVSDVGVVTAVAPGTATITVGYREDWTYFTDTVVVTVPTPAVHNITQDKYYTTIEGAIAVADANDTIEVAAGTYEPVGTLTIEDRGLTLRSIDGPATTIIYATFAANTPCIQISAPRVKVEGFTVKDKEGGFLDGIYISDIAGIDASYAIVTGNKLDNAIIFCFAGGDHSIISNNTIDGGGINLESDLGNLTDVTIKGNNISDGNINMNDGILYDDILITENTISESGIGYAGIDVRGTVSNFRITHNDITDNPGGGIEIYATCTWTLAVGNVIIYNNIEGNGGFGLKVDPAITVEVDAILNWWGDASGPSSAGPGTGDAVIGSGVDFEPWSLVEN